MTLQTWLISKLDKDHSRLKAEIHRYTKDLRELSDLRDKALQNARLYTKENTQVYQDEVARYTEHIEMAGKVLAWLLDEQEAKLQPRKRKSV